MDSLEHSGLGIASLLISSASSILIFTLSVVASTIGLYHPEAFDENSSTAIYTGIIIFIFLGISILALGLGIAGLFQKNRRKLFILLGIASSVFTTTGIITMIILGVLYG